MCKFYQNDNDRHLLLLRPKARQGAIVIVCSILYISSPSIASFQHFRNRNYSLISNLRVDSGLDTNYFHHHHHHHPHNCKQQHDQLPSLNFHHYKTRTHNRILFTPKIVRAREPLTKQLAKRRNTSQHDDYDDDNNKKNEDDILKKVIQPLESVLSFLSTPIPNDTSSYSLPLVYPLVMIGLNLVLDSLTTVLLLDFFFVLFYIFARSAIIVQGDNDDDINDDDDDDEFLNLNSRVLDLVALFGSITSAGLVSPAGLSITIDDVGIEKNVGSALLILCFSFGVLNIISGINDGDSDGDGGDNHEHKNNLKDKNNDDLSSDLFSEWDRKFKDL